MIQIMICQHIISVKLHLGYITDDLDHDLDHDLPADRSLRKVTGSMISQIIYCAVDRHLSDLSNKLFFNNLFARLQLGTHFKTTRFNLSVPKMGRHSRCVDI